MGPTQSPEDNGPFELRTETIGAMPIINHFCAKLDLEEKIARHLNYNKTEQGVSPDKSVGIILRNIILGKDPLYGLNEWGAKFPPDFFDLQPCQIELLNDDRFGRALDKMYDADRATLMTEIVVKAVNVFGINLNQLHNDSTTITFSGEYKDANGEIKRGKETLMITFGKNKDHRPDLKQLVWILTVSADGAVPVHVRVCDGNTTDDTTHIETWNALCKLTGRKDFYYVADSKLCVRETMMHIDGNDGIFITIMPRTRAEHELFKKHLVNNKVDWKEVRREKDPRGKNKPDLVWRAVESLIDSTEGFRIVWYRSSQKEKQDLKKRQKTIEKTASKLEELHTKLQGKKCRLKKRESIAEVAETIIENNNAKDWVGYNLNEEVETTYKQEKSGRPGPDTRYIPIHNPRFGVYWYTKKEGIKESARWDGIFAIITNSNEIFMDELLSIYKYQPNLEKRHEQLKTILIIVPMFLKSITRIEGFLFLYFVALLIQSLIERQARLGMKKAGLKSIPIYHEKRECSAPTAYRILDTFSDLQRHYLYKDGKLVQTFYPEYTELHYQLLDLLEVPREAYPGLG